MAARRKAKRRNRPAKKTGQKRLCPSGKREFKYEGEARAYDKTGKGLHAYRCRDCGKWHLADPVSRYERRRRAARGEL